MGRVLLAASAGIFLGSINLCVMGPRGQNITVPLEWDGPTWVVCEMGWDGKLGRLSSMGTTSEYPKTEMGWDGMRLMCHTMGGRRWD